MIYTEKTYVNNAIKNINARVNAIKTNSWAVAHAETVLQGGRNISGRRYSAQNGVGARKLEALIFLQVLKHQHNSVVNAWVAVNVEITQSDFRDANLLNK